MYLKFLYETQKQSYQQKVNRKYIDYYTFYLYPIPSNTINYNVPVSGQFI